MTCPCGDDRLYYTDETNESYYCRACWSLVREGIPPMTAQTETLPDIAQARTMADAALASLQGTAAHVLAIEAVHTAEDAQAAIDEAKKYREIKRAGEAERDTVCKPLRAQATAHSKRWAGFIAMAEQLERHCKALGLDYQSRAAAQAQQALAAGVTSHTELARAQEALTTKPAGMSVRKTYRAKVVDPSKVPAQYWLIDEARLDREARAAKDKFAVPGVELVVEETAVLR
jgi:hypothetical protein